MPRPIRYGPIPGVEPGDLFRDRRELSRAGVHRPTRAGISGSAKGPADSLVVAGRYEDDDDRGPEILYAGMGGNDPATGRQIADQTLTRANAALALNLERNVPVRVIRAAAGGGYRYDGLYRVADAWAETGLSGFRVWRFRLLALENSDPDDAPDVTASSRGTPPTAPPAPSP